MKGADHKLQLKKNLKTSLKKTPNNTLVQILKSKKCVTIQENLHLVLASSQDEAVGAQGGLITIVMSQVHFEHLKNFAVTNKCF